MSDVKLYRGDCLKVLKRLPDGSVDAVVTDPPYGVNYTCREFDDSPEAWAEKSPAVLAECKRLTSGPILWFAAASTLERDTVLLRPERILIWAPRFTLAKSHKNGVFFRWHPVFAWNLAALPRDSSGIVSDVFTESSQARKEWPDHPAKKPLPLMERLVRTANIGRTILDPFMGSGTTGVACAMTGRNFIGVEIHPEYFAIAKRRIAAARRTAETETAAC